MSGAKLTECTSVARTSSAPRTAANATAAAMVDLFAMLPPSDSGGGQRESSSRASGDNLHVHGRARPHEARPRQAVSPARGGERIADAVPFHPSPERDARDAERRGGALAVPAMLVEPAQDARPLVEEEPARRRVTAREHLVERPATSARKDEEGLERVLELAHVSGPRVFEERPERGRRRCRDGRAVRGVEARDEV